MRDPAHAEPSGDRVDTAAIDAPIADGAIRNPHRSAAVAVGERTVLRTVSFDRPIPAG